MPRTKTSFGPGNPPPKSPGRPRTTEEEKRKARLQRAVDFDFKAECRALLPLATERVAELLEKKREMKPVDATRVFEVLRDSVHGKPAQALTGPDGGPLVFTFAQLVANVDGAKKEKI